LRERHRARKARRLLHRITSETNRGGVPSPAFRRAPAFRHLQFPVAPCKGFPMATSTFPKRLTAVGQPTVPATLVNPGPHTPDIPLAAEPPAAASDVTDAISALIGDTVAHAALGPVADEVPLAAAQALAPLAAAKPVLALTGAPLLRSLETLRDAHQQVFAQTLAARQAAAQQLWSNRNPAEWPGIYTGWVKAEFAAALQFWQRVASAAVPGVAIDAPAAQRAGAIGFTGWNGGRISPAATVGLDS
jgi:hypothetical protein